MKDRKRESIKPTNIDEIIGELCEAVPEEFMISSLGGRQFTFLCIAGDCKGSWPKRERTLGFPELECYLPLIAQYALHWAAQAEPLPVINIHPATLPNSPGPFSIDIFSNKAKNRTAHYFYDFIDIMSESKARIKAVTEYALLLKKQQ